MKNPLVLTFDVGTQSARGLLVTKEGNFVDKCQIKYDEPYYSRHPGWAEQRPDFYFDKLCEISNILFERNQDKKDSIVAVAITTIRDTVICLDKNGTPLRDIILWLDKRKATFESPFNPITKLMFKLVGMTDATKTIYKTSVVNWIKQNQPEIWEKTDKFVMLSTYLNYKFTGVLADSAANMIGHIPFDYKKRKWKKKGDLTRCICDVPDEKLCELVDSGSKLGTISKDVSALTGIPTGLPFIASGSDKGCETLGLSVTNENQAAISFGTTATIQMAVHKYFEPQKFMPAYPAVPNNLFNPEIEIYRGFWLLSWFVKEFGAEERLLAEKKGCSPEQILDKAIEKIPPGSDGLMLQPFWTPGIMNPDTHGAVVGFADFHTHYHLYRAIIEGLDFELYRSLKSMEHRSGKKIEELFVGGGGAKSDIVCKITADIFGLPVKRIQNHEACSIGASMVAFKAIGEFSDYSDAIKSMVRIQDVFTPDPKNHEIYMHLFQKAYRKLDKKLYPINKKINKIYKRR